MKQRVEKVERNEMRGVGGRKEENKLERREVRKQCSRGERARE